MSLVIKGERSNGLYKNVKVDGYGNLQANTLYPVSPVMTLYSPSGTAYVKVTPDPTNLAMFLRPVVTTETLQVASILTHKIADTTTTIGASDPGAANLGENQTAADEIIADCNTHIASTAYHVAAGAVIYPCHKAVDATNTTAANNMSSLATGYVLADELDDDVTAHLLSTVFHLVATTAADFGGTPATEGALRTKVNLLRTAMIAHFGSATVHSVADAENLRLATATTVGSDEASDQTLINLLKTYWNSHVGVCGTTADLPAVIAVANAAKAGVLAHMNDATTAHGGVGDATNSATLTAVPAASNLATSATLLHAIKDTYNAHCAITDGSAFLIHPAGVMEWPCLGSFFAKTNVSAHTFVTEEFRSA